MSDKPTALMVTALALEYDAVRAYLTNIHETTNLRGLSYEIGTFCLKECIWHVGLVQLLEPGNEAAALATSEAIGHFKPQVVMFVGIAGGIKDVDLGDVVVGTKIYGYASGAAGRKFLPRPDVGESSEILLQQALSASRRKEWLERVKTSSLSKKPRVFLSPIAAGPAVLRSKTSIVYKFLKDSYGDALAVEMEGRGFLKATRVDGNIRAVVVRGISDLINKKAATDRAGWQLIAADHAAAFAFEILSRQSTSDREVSERQNPYRTSDSSSTVKAPTVVASESPTKGGPLLRTYCIRLPQSMFARSLANHLCLSPDGASITLAEETGDICPDRSDFKISGGTRVSFSFEDTDAAVMIALRECASGLLKQGFGVTDRVIEGWRKRWAGDHSKVGEDASIMVFLEKLTGDIGKASNGDLAHSLTSYAYDLPEDFDRSFLNHLPSPSPTQDMIEELIRREAWEEFTFTMIDLSNGSRGGIGILWACDVVRLRSHIQDQKIREDLELSKPDSSDALKTWGQNLFEHWAADSNGIGYAKWLLSQNTSKSTKEAIGILKNIVASLPKSRAAEKAKLMLETKKAQASKAGSASDEVSKNTSELDGVPSQIGSDPPPPPPPNRASLEKDDIQKNRWGGKAKGYGRRLFISTVNMEKEYFEFEAVLESTDATPLEHPFFFHLHDTYKPNKIKISRTRYDGKQAVLERGAEGTFTIGVQFKDAKGEWRSLEYDLASYAKGSLRKYD